MYNIQLLEIYITDKGFLTLCSQMVPLNYRETFLGGCTFAFFRFAFLSDSIRFPKTF